MGSHRELLLLNKKCNCYDIDTEFDVVPAFADDRLTICSKNQEAALNSLRANYGAGYGKPIPGSACDIRGQEYQKAVTLEVLGLCRIISTNGFRLKNGHTLMLFKDIFQIYQSISNKVVGILARARKNRLVHFEGETLFQGTSDDTNVTLLRSAADIENHFKATKELLYNEDAKNLYVIRLRNGLYNTFCISMNFSTTTPAMPLESCQSLSPFHVESEKAGPSNHVSTTPPLLSYKIAPELHIKTARKPIELQPTEIRLNRGLRSFDKPKTDRIVLDFGSSDLVSSGLD